METITLTLKLNRSTKKMHRYDEVDAEDNPISLYLRQKDMPTPPPDGIEVNITESEDS